MFRLVVRAVVSLFVLLPHVAAAEPITLKLSFFSSNLSMSYLAAVKPFVDAVNAEAKGLVEIKVYFRGALGKDIAQQPQLVLDGAERRMPYQTHSAFTALIAEWEAASPRNHKLLT